MHRKSVTDRQHVLSLVAFIVSIEVNQEMKSNPEEGRSSDL